MSDALMILAHPASGRLSDALAEAWAGGARAAGARVAVLALRELAFDPILREVSGRPQPLEPDLKHAQAALVAARHLVFAYPTWWGGPPTLLRGFIDRAFLPGFAYKNTGKALPEGLLAGRTARLITSMDSPWWWYWLRHGRAGHRQLTAATLNYCGVRGVTETTVYALRTLTAAQRQAAIDRARAHGLTDGRRLTAAR